MIQFSLKRISTVRPKSCGGDRLRQTRLIPRSPDGDNNDGGGDDNGGADGEDNGGDSDDDDDGDDNVNGEDNDDDDEDNDGGDNDNVQNECNQCVGTTTLLCRLAFPFSDLRIQ